VGSNVQIPDVRPLFGKPAQTGAEKEDVSGETRTYGNPTVI